MSLDLSYNRNIEIGDDEVKKKMASTRGELSESATSTETQQETARLIEEIGPEVFGGMESIVKTLIRFKVEMLLPVFKLHFKGNDAKTRAAVKTVMRHVLESSDD